MAVMLAKAPTRRAPHIPGIDNYVGISSQDDLLRYMGSASNNQMLDLCSMMTWKHSAGCQCGACAMAVRDSIASSDPTPKQPLEGLQYRYCRSHDLPSPCHTSADVVESFMRWRISISQLFDPLLLLW